MLTYQISKIAQKDLESAKTYHKQNSSLASFDKILNNIFKLFDLICTQPNMGTVVQFSKLKQYRWIIAAPYYIFYKQDANKICIQRILHASRNIRHLIQND